MILRGIGASGGVGMGPAVCLRAAAPDRAGRGYAGVEDERARLRAASCQVERETAALAERMRVRAGESEPAILTGQITMLRDPELELQLDRAIQEGETAEAAVDAVFGGYIRLFEGLEDERMRLRAADIRDLQSRLLRALLGRREADLSRLPAGCVLVTRELTPSMAVGLDRERVAAILTETGGSASHAAILTRALGIPAVLGAIVTGAFSPMAVTGGIVGSFFTSMQKGVARGIFSNEAGLGTGSIAHACADTQEPVRQGLFGIFEVFADTVVICTLTALVILLSGVPVSYGQAAGAELTISGFVATYGNWVTIFTAVAMCCFAFSTIIGWGLYGARCVEFLFSSRAIAPFMVVYSLVAILGATADLGLLWSIAETFNGLMSIPNLIALFLLSGTLLRLVRGALDGGRAPRGRA